MSFFSRKPNPPTPPVAHKLLAAVPAPSPSIKAPAVNNPFAGPLMPVGASGQNSTAENQPTPSNTRFRSFCERYIVERCRDWKEGEVEERAWAAILEARSIYNKVKEVGRTLTNDT